YITIVMTIAFLFGIIVYILKFDISNFIYAKLHISNILNPTDYTNLRFGLIRYTRGIDEALNLFASHPVTGVGLNQYYNYVNQDSAFVLPPFDLLASIGIFGFTSFTLFLVFIMRKISTLRSLVPDKSHIDYYLLSAGLIYLAIVIVKSSTASRFNYPSTLFWFDLSMAGLILYNIKRQNNP
ncbi:MAG TPA: hypothetical protein VN316_02535, partial [candidate division Zixibacteria bacterium]|nr:hypothetical protein [candidate division Zixibacteria bacterium]